MKFATIMREAGISEKLFLECAEINVVLYDEDDEICAKEDIEFIKPLFVENPDSFEKFFNFVDELNSNPDYLTINVLITEHYVVVHYKTNHAKVFRRTPSPDPLIFAD